MNTPQIFKYQDKQCRTITKDGEPWFVAKDVADILSIEKYRDMVARLPGNQREPVLVDTLGGQQTMTAVNEAGLYKLIFSSRKPEAEAFTDWVATDVLPSIRKHGMYATEDLLNNPDLLIQVATKLKEEKELRQAAELRLIEQAPKVEFAEACLASEDAIYVGDLAKLACKNGIEIGEKRLFKKLREWKLLNGFNMPYQRYIDAKYFEVKQSSFQMNGETHTHRTTMVRQPGVQYIIRKLRESA